MLLGCVVSYYTKLLSQFSIGYPAVQTCHGLSIIMRPGHGSQGTHKRTQTSLGSYKPTAPSRE